MSERDENEAVRRDDPMIAAEYVLGLLEGDELAQAREKAGQDGEFAWRRDWWNNWFAPLADEIVPMEPGPQVWQRIERDIAAHAADRTTAGAAATGATYAPLPEAANDRDIGEGRVVTLERKVRRWQWVAGLTSAAAAVLLAMFVLSPEPQPAGPPAIAAADPMIASMPIGESGTRLGIAYLPESAEILVSASGVSGDGVHDHELWVVPPDGAELLSLGIIRPGQDHRMAISPDAAQAMDAGARLVLTREPIGGKPEGEAAGPVVAEGDLSPV